MYLFLNLTNSDFLGYLQLNYLKSSSDKLIE